MFEKILYSFSNRFVSNSDGITAMFSQPYVNGAKLKQKILKTYL